MNGKINKGKKLIIFVASIIIITLGIMCTSNVNSDVKAADTTKDIEFDYSSAALDRASIHLVNKAVYNDEYFYKPSTEYNHELAKLSQAIVLATGNTSESFKNWGENDTEVIDTSVIDEHIDYEKHRNAYIVEVYKKLGFYNDEYTKYDVSLNDDSNTCGYSIAMKDIKVKGKKYKLVSANVRCVNYGAEWASNFYLTDNSGNTGFAHAGRDFYNGIKAYIKKYKLGKNTKVWIPGFSRGAGAANVAAALLDKDIEKGMYKFKKQDVFAYMCATPMATLDEDYDNIRYNNIFNIVIESDPVALVAPKYWGFHRYGRVITIPHLYASSSDIKKIENGQNVDMPKYQVDLMKQISKEYNEIRYKNALNDKSQGDRIFPGFRVGLGITNIMDYVAQMFGESVYEYGNKWQEVMVDITPFVIGQNLKYDETKNEWVEYDSLAEYLCDNYGEDVINKAVEVGVFSQSEYNSKIEKIYNLYKKNVITEDMRNLYIKSIDTIYGIKILAVKNDIDVEDIKDFVGRTMGLLPEIKEAMTPLMGAVNCKANHYGEFYLAWLRTYNPYTHETLY